MTCGRSNKENVNARIENDFAGSRRIRSFASTLNRPPLVDERIGLSDISRYARKLARTLLTIERKKQKGG